MTQINLPFNILPGQLEDISQVMADLQAIVAVVNGGLGNDNMTPSSPLAIDKIQGGPEGSTLITGPGGTPSWQPAGGEAPGVIKAFGGDNAPAGYLMCDGSAVSRATYATLFAVVQEKYGAGDGINTFGLPNLKGKIPVGKDAAQGEFDALGESAGAKVEALAVGHMPSHKHGGGAHGHGTYEGGGHQHGPYPNVGGGQFVSTKNSFQGPYGEALAYAGPEGPQDLWFAPATALSTTGLTIVASGEVIAAEGGGAAHNNLQPYLVVNYIIKT